MLYTLLDAGNKRISFNAFFDVMGGDYAQTIGYPASYDILNGYSDGAFRLNTLISRAAFAVLLHRCQPAAPVEQYSDVLSFSDVSVDYWAEDALYSANTRTAEQLLMTAWCRLFWREKHSSAG